MKNDHIHLKDRLRPCLFWDVDFATLDLRKHAAFIIVRVMERGTREEARLIWHHYGAETVRKHLLAARSLDKRTVSYFASQFKVDRSDFRCTHNPSDLWDGRV